METIRKYFGAALIACAVLVLPALVFAGRVSVLDAFNVAVWFGLAGAVTVTYKYPVSSTTPPTATQSSQVQAVTATINWLEADTTGTITHNFGLQTATFPGNTGQLFPEIIFYPTAGQTVAADYRFVLTDGNVITFHKTAGNGTGGTVHVIVRRPHSVGF